VAGIRLESVDKVFPNGHAACRAIDLDIRDGECLVLVGPSGCGKSTLLRLIAGLDSPSAGRILIGGADVTAVPPQARDLAMVFQSYALYPHMTVRENLAYGLRVRRVDPQTSADRIRTIAAALGLEPLLDRRPGQLSGGQRQRVALGRAMVRQPRAFLLDEPLSNLDPALRLQARAELLRLQQSLQATLVYVTHDQEEAMTLGSRVAVMRNGAIVQVAPPLDLYAAPASTFVATFIGSPPMNLLPPSAAGLARSAGTTVGIRPHDLAFADDGPVSGLVDIVEPRGHETVVHLRLDEAPGTPVIVVTRNIAPPAGSRVRLTVPPDRVHVFDANGTRTG
jgi:multiple sugar transport system ATP-binding protein